CLPLRVGLASGLGDRFEGGLEHLAEALPASRLGRTADRLDQTTRRRLIAKARKLRVGIGRNSRCRHVCSPSDQPRRISRVRAIIRRVAPITLRLASYDRCASRRSVISTSGLTFGCFTLPLAS